MINKTMTSNYISETNIEYEIEINTNNEIIIWVMLNKHGSTGYEFPVYNGKIDWESQKENWALLPSDVIKEANKFAKTCHLIVFS